MAFTLTSREISTSSVSSERAVKFILALIYVIMTVAAVFYLSSQIDDSDPGADSNQNLRMAYHLAKSGVIAYNQADEATGPTMKREPLPVAVLAATMLLHPELSTTQSLAEMTSGNSLIILKHVNLLWAVLLFGGIFGLTWAFSQDLLWRILVPPGVIYLVTFAFLTGSPGNVNRMTTEIEVSSLMVWAALLMLLLVRSPTIGNGVALGAILGCAALVKATFVPISVGAFAMLAATMLFVRRKAVRGELLPSTIEKASYLGGVRPIAKVLSIAVLIFTAVVCVWSARNWLYFDQFRVADRGGDVLYFRLLLSKEPLDAGIFAFSSGRYRIVLEPLLDFSRDDLQDGGRLAAFGGETESIKRLRWQIYRDRWENAGHSFSRSEAEAWLAREALKEYLRDPVRYVASVGLFAYRGSFWMSRAFPRPGSGWSHWVRALPEHVSILLTVNFLLVAFGSLLLRKPEIFVVFVIPLGMYMVHAMFTHNIPRYNIPITPFIGFALAVVCAYITRHAASSVAPIVLANRHFSTQGEATARGQ